LDNTRLFRTLLFKCSGNSSSPDSDSTVRHKSESVFTDLRLVALLSWTQHNIRVVSKK
jgi:hypothetical protein